MRLLYDEIGFTCRHMISRLDDRSPILRKQIHKQIIASAECDSDWQQEYNEWKTLQKKLDEVNRALSRLRGPVPLDPEFQRWMEEKLY